MRALRIRQAVLERVLRRQKRDDALARDVRAEIEDEMAEVVLFLHADRAVGEEHVRALPRQPLDGVIRVDPRIHALGGRELRARRAQLGCEDRCAGVKSVEEIQLFYYTVP